MKLTAVTLPLAALCAPVLAQTPSHADGGHWYDDFDAALAAAKEADKDLLVDFTGSDWCRWCIVLHDEVFAQEAWIEEASKDFVFVALDFDGTGRAKSNAPNPARSNALKEQHGVSGFPTVLLMNSDGIAYARTGYQRGGPASYLAHVREISAEGKAALAEVQRVVAAFQGTADDTAEARWAAWDAVVEELDGLDPGSPFATLLVEHVRWGFDSDAKNELGKRVAATRSLLRAGVLDDDLAAAAEALDAKNEVGALEALASARFDTVRDETSARVALALLDKVNEHGFHDDELAFQMNFTAASWSAGGLQDPTAARGYARIARALGTEDARLQAALDQWIGD